MSQTPFRLGLCSDTLVKTQCCGTHPCGPTVDTRRSTVWLGTREVTVTELGTKDDVPHSALTNPVDAVNCQPPLFANDVL